MERNYKEREYMHNIDLTNTVDARNQFTDS